MSEKIRIAMGQRSYVVENSKDDNIRQVLADLKEAATGGAEILLMPEMYITGFPLEIDKFLEMGKALYEENSLALLQEGCKKNNIALFVGMPGYDPKTGKIYNTNYFIDHQGAILARYDKIQLFMFEKDYVSPGDTLKVFNYKGINFGLMVCFELEFPELGRALAIGGAEVLLAISANMEPYALYHRIGAQARALENQVFVAYCNRSGRTETTIFTGESCIVNPYGEMVVEADGSREQMIYGEIDLAQVDQSRKDFFYLEEIVEGIKVEKCS